MDTRTLENRVLKVSVDERGWFDVLEKETGTIWRHDPFEDSPGELTLKRKNDGRLVTFDLGCASSIDGKQTDDDALEFTFSGFKTDSGEKPLDVSVKTRLSLDTEEPDLKAGVLEVTYPDEWNMVSLLYPARHFYLETFKEEGYLAIPAGRGQGSIVPSGRFREAPELNFPVWDDSSYAERAVIDLECGEASGLSMPWFGTVKGQSAFICVLDTPDDATARCIFNYDLQHIFSQRGETSPYPRIASASPLWQSQKGKLGYPRNLTFHFMPGGNYVGMAKYYRGVAERNGLLKTLREKIKENPNVEKLLGAPMINMDACYPWYVDYPAFAFTWQDVKETVTDLHDNLGLDRALFIVWGGYSKLPPESLPFNPGFGTVEELRETVKTAHEKGFLFCFYDAYPPLLEHAPSWDPKLALKYEGGGLHRNRWIRLCSEFFLEYAKKNLPVAIDTTKQIVEYQDCLGCRRVECYDPEHPTTREKDRKNKEELYDYIRSLDLVLGAEFINEWTVPYLDYAKGGLASGRWFSAISVPLFNLVFHDCLVLYGTYDLMHRRIGVSFLRDLAYGNHPQFAFPKDAYNGCRDDIQHVNRVSHDYLKTVACDELVDHEYLTDTYDVERTRFSSGVTVTINLGRQDYASERGKMPPLSFSIEYPDGSIQTGRVNTTIESRLM